MSIDERREAELLKYERPAYFGLMRHWRQVLVSEWLTANASLYDEYLDVGCGPAETRNMAKEWSLRWRGCDVVRSVCDFHDVDLIPGAHDLPYDDNAFHITTCNDVLEHVLEEDVPAALREMSRVTSKAILLGISRKGRPPDSTKSLPIYHITIKPEDWWLRQISENMEGAWTVLYDDRIPKIKRPYLWVEIR